MTNSLLIIAVCLLLSGCAALRYEVGYRQGHKMFYDYKAGIMEEGLFLGFIDGYRNEMKVNEAEKIRIINERLEKRLEKLLPLERKTRKNRAN